MTSQWIGDRLFVVGLFQVALMMVSVLLVLLLWRLTLCCISGCFGEGFCIDVPVALVTVSVLLFQMFGDNDNVLMFQSLLVTVFVLLYRQL